MKEIGRVLSVDRNVGGLGAAVIVDTGAEIIRYGTDWNVGGTVIGKGLDGIPGGVGKAHGLPIDGESDVKIGGDAFLVPRGKRRAREEREHEDDGGQSFFHGLFLPLIDKCRQSCIIFLERGLQCLFYSDSRSPVAAGGRDFYLLSELYFTYSAPQIIFHFTFLGVSKISIVYFILQDKLI